MDGAMFGKLIVDIVLAYLIGKSAWNKTQSSGKTTIVVIIALISPLIAWVVYALFSPAEKSNFDMATRNNGSQETNHEKITEKNDEVIQEKYELNYESNSEEMKRESKNKEFRMNEVERKDISTTKRTLAKNDFKSIDFCKFCGTKLNDDAQFCHKCGRKVG